MTANNDAYGVADEESSEAAISSKVYICEECGQSFSKPSKLNVHIMAKHTGERPFKCDVEGCNWAFTANYKLKRHKECHEKKKECMCPIEGCGKLFSNIYNLNQHMKLHSRPKLHTCDACGEGFGTRKKLDVHMKIHGDQFKKFKCPVEGCDKMFFSELSMGSHQRTHERNRHFVCRFEGCGREFTMPCKLHAHERTHTGEKPYECPYPLCSARFSSSSHLTRHLKTHTNKRDFVCKECGKAFLRSEHLKGHMASHTGERPHACWFPNCTARFTAKSTLYVHMKRHPHCDASPLVCPLEGCGRHFNDKATLRGHIDEHFGRQATSNAAAKVVTSSPATFVAVSGGATQIVNAVGTSGAMIKSEVADVKPIVVNSTSKNVIPGNRPIQPTSVILNTVPKPPNTSPAVTSQALSTAATPNNVMTFLNVAINGGVSEMGPVLLTPELAHSLIAASGVSMVSNEYMSTDQAQQMMESGHALVEADQSSNPVSFLEKPASAAGDSGGEDSCSEGCARTDYQRNHLMSIKVKKRRMILKQKAAQAGFDLASFQEIANNSKLVSSSYTDSGDGAQGPVMNPNEVMTSRAITIRDPETGAVYVQTQLLQDDPPNMEFDEPSSVDSKSLLPDYRALLQENSTSAHPNGGVVVKSEKAKSLLPQVGETVPSNAPTADLTIQLPRHHGETNPDLPLIFSDMVDAQGPQQQSAAMAQIRTMAGDPNFVLKTEQTNPADFQQGSLVEQEFQLENEPIHRHIKLENGDTNIVGDGDGAVYYTNDMVTLADGSVAMNSVEADATVIFNEQSNTRLVTLPDGTQTYVTFAQPDATMDTEDIISPTMQLAYCDVTQQFVAINEDISIVNADDDVHNDATDASPNMFVSNGTGELMDVHASISAEETLASASILQEMVTSS